MHSNSFLQNRIIPQGISFILFTCHMSIGAILLMLQTAVHLRIRYSNIKELKLDESRECQNLRRQIHVWKVALEKVLATSKAENLVGDTLRAKIKYMTRKLKKMEQSGTETKESYELTLHELNEQVRTKKSPFML